MIDRESSKGVTSSVQICGSPCKRLSANLSSTAAAHGCGRLPLLRYGDVVVMCSRAVLHLRDMGLGKI
jgi:hypothetical protein